MGYYSNSFAFYGFEVESIAWDQFDVLQTTSPICMVVTGCQATSNPPHRFFVILKTSFHQIQDGNYGITDAHPLIGSVTGLDYEASRNFCKDNNLTIKDAFFELPKFRWFVGCSGG